MYFNFYNRFRSSFLQHFSQHLSYDAYMFICVARDLDFLSCFFSIAYLPMAGNWACCAVGMLWVQSQHNQLQQGYLAMSGTEGGSWNLLLRFGVEEERANVDAKALLGCTGDQPAICLLWNLQSTEIT